MCTYIWYHKNKYHKKLFGPAGPNRLTFFDWTHGCIKAKIVWAFQKKNSTFFKNLTFSIVDFGIGILLWK